jgi:hypothetical protein
MGAPKHRTDSAPPASAPAPLTEDSVDILLGDRGKMRCHDLRAWQRLRNMTFTAPLSSRLSLRSSPKP